MLAIPNPILRQIHETGVVIAPSGERVPWSNAGGIDWCLAEALYATVVTHRPRRVLEVGMASGISSLCILTALAENGGEGTLTSVDPFQSSLCRGAGVAHVARAGFADRHRLIERFDYLALPELVAAEGATFDLVYIDGNHDFDYVVLDAFYADQLLVTGGLMCFNDCGWRTVHAALRRVPPRGRYEEIDVGLKQSYRGRNVVATAERWVTGRSNSDRYFRKQS